MGLFFLMPSATPFLFNSKKKGCKENAATALSLFGVLQIDTLGNQALGAYTPSQRQKARPCETAFGRCAAFKDTGSITAYEDVVSVSEYCTGSTVEVARFVSIMCLFGVVTGPHRGVIIGLARVVFEKCAGAVNCAV